MQMCTSLVPLHWTHQQTFHLLRSPHTKVLPQLGLFIYQSDIPRLCSHFIAHWYGIIAPLQLLIFALFRYKVMSVD